MRDAPRNHMNVPFPSAASRLVELSVDSQPLGELLRLILCCRAIRTKAARTMALITNPAHSPAFKSIVENAYSMGGILVVQRWLLEPESSSVVALCDKPAN